MRSPINALIFTAAIVWTDGRKITFSVCDSVKREDQSTNGGRRIYYQTCPIRRILDTGKHIEATTPCPSSSSE